MQQKQHIFQKKLRKIKKSAWHYSTNVVYWLCWVEKTQHYKHDQRVKKRIEDYPTSYFVETAKSLLDLLQYGSGEETKKQITLLEKYIEKHEIKNGQASIDKWLEEV